MLIILSPPDSKVFVQITVDPFAPSSLEITITGPSYCIGNYRQMYDDRIRDWDPNFDIHKNLLRIFGTLNALFITLLIPLIKCGVS